MPYARLSNMLPRNSQTIEILMYYLAHLSMFTTPFLFDAHQLAQPPLCVQRRVLQLSIYHCIKSHIHTINIFMELSH